MIDFEEWSRKTFPPGGLNEYSLRNPGREAWDYQQKIIDELKSGKDYWIYKGDSNFTDNPRYDDDFNEIPYYVQEDQFYDLVSEKPIIGGIHVKEIKE